eukprot:718776_1
MPKTIKKLKGNRFEKVCYHVPFYTNDFFNPEGDKEEGEVTSKPSPVVKIPVKIKADGDDSRSNVTTFEMNSISHFENNVENVLETLSQLEERVVKPKAIEDPNEEIKERLQLLQLICNRGPASQTLQESAKMARTYVYEKYIKGTDDEVEEDILREDEKAFFDYISQEFTDMEDTAYENTEEYTNHLFQEFNRVFRNNLNSVIFGADAYRAFKQQNDYMLNKIVKPFGATVEASFRRIEVMSNMLKFFPPPGSRGKMATKRQWNAFQVNKKIL